MRLTYDNTYLIILLSVIDAQIRDIDGSESQFKMRCDAPLQKLMDAYCQHMQTPNNTYRFLFDGRRVTRKDTPRSLAMHDLDTIDALIHQTGGW